MQKTHIFSFHRLDTLKCMILKIFWQNSILWTFLRKRKVMKKNRKN
nr:MAG TPA: hypothetical protein [Caudoviricetes sp.]